MVDHVGTRHGAPVSVHAASVRTRHRYGPFRRLRSSGEGRILRLGVPKSLKWSFSVFHHAFTCLCEEDHP